MITIPNTEIKIHTIVIVIFDDDDDDDDDEMSLCTLEKWFSNWLLGATD